MRELSIFVDKSGDFGEYDFHSPFYIISLVFHDQNIDITEDLKKLERELSNIGWSEHCIVVCIARQAKQEGSEGVLL